MRHSEHVNYQEMIIALERYWADYGCVLMQPYHTELAAGTMNPNTFLRCLGPKPWNVAYVEPVIRPLAEAGEAGLSTRATRDALAVVNSSHEFHGGFRLRTLAR